MPKYYGCPCEGCGKPLTLRDDIVVCPDCGAPYHRDCYEKLGRCIHSAAHAAGYEWKFPYQESELCTCPACGERTLRSEEHCRCCGAVLPPEGAEEPADRSEDPGEGSFDYSSFYRQFQETGTPSADPMKQAYEAAFGKEEAMDGIPCADWASYIGPASPAYMNTYCRMQLAHSKVSMSFSALLFGPFYFFYRKAWKPAFGFLAAEMLLAAPTYIELRQHTPADGRALNVRLVALPQERCREDQAHPGRVLGRSPAQSRSGGAGRREHCRRVRLLFAADGRRQCGHSAAGPQCGCPHQSGLRLMHPA